MGTPPDRNVRTREYRELYDRLPSEIRELADAAYELFRENPEHPSLRRHMLEDRKRGRHRQNSFSVSITMKYRAIGVVDGATTVWYWIGTHADHDVFTGKK
jgi:hypothetical protein